MEKKNPCGQRGSTLEARRGSSAWRWWSTVSRSAAAITGGVFLPSSTLVPAHLRFVTADVGLTGESRRTLGAFLALSIVLVMVARGGGGGVGEEECRLLFRALTHSRDTLQSAKCTHIQKLGHKRDFWASICYFMVCMLNKDFSPTKLWCWFSCMCAYWWKQRTWR